MQREALNGTQFKVVVADATIRNLKTAQVGARLIGSHSTACILLSFQGPHSETY